jgi:hypothetical protein
MRLGLKLAAFGIALLLSKTDLYFSKSHLSEAQTASQLSLPIAHPHVNSTAYLTGSAKQAESSTCAAKPGHDGRDTVAVHASDETPKGS